MPPSPALRFSPVRDRRRDRKGNRKRGQSLESGLTYKEKEDDLALFNEVRNREKNSLLLHSLDDSDNLISTKLASFSDFNLRISIPVPGDRNDLFNVSSEKNDYDWLLTPPDTPPFPSLDDETPPTNIADRGRSQTQPIPISRNVKTEKSCRDNRTSENPHHSSLCLRSVNDTSRSKGRPSSHPSSPTPVSHSTTPSRRPSSPNKPSAPLRRSSSATSTLQQMNTGGPRSLSVSRASSPGGATRGNSALLKVKEWESSFPDFSLDPPPNLRTSLLDRPASHVRGSSPVSRNGLDSFLRVRQQAISPIVSRGASPLYNYDQDQFSSHSKGSAAASGNDDVDSSKSVIVGTNHPTSNKTPTCGNKNETFVSMAFSKNPSRFQPSTGSVLRQDNHKVSQCMFRPVLSSVPGNAFYVGKANNAHHRNSSSPTGSYVISNQGSRFAPNSECCNHHHEALASVHGKTHHSDIHEELFMFDKTNVGNENLQHQVGSEDPFNWLQSVNGSVSSDARIQESENLHNREAVCSHIAGEFLDVDGNKVIPSSSIDGSNYMLMETMNRNVNVCADNAKKCGPLIVTQDSTIHSRAALEGNKICEMEPIMGLPELSKVISGQDMICLQESNVDQGPGWSRDGYLKLMLMQGDQHLADLQSESNQHIIGHLTGSCKQSTCCGVDEQLKCFSDNLNLQADSSEEADISVFLRRSSSRWSVVQGKATTAMDLPHEDVTCARNISDTTKSSISQASVSLSLDLGSKIETQIKHSGPSIAYENVILHHDLRETDGSSSPAASSLALAKSNYKSSPGSKDVAKTFLETSNSETLEKNEEPIVIVDGRRGQKSRILTLEEVTDTILFCSSIIHNLAYEATCIAIEKEQSILLEESQHTVTIIGKSDSNRNSPHRRTCSPKPQKVRKTRMQTDVKTSSLKTENDKNIQQPSSHDSDKVDSMRTLKLEARCNCTVM